MIVYKKVRLMKDGALRPLFIGKDKPFIIGKWQHCEYIPTRGFAPRSIVTTDNSKIGGWHCCFTPLAPHIADRLSSGEQRVWLECEARGRSTKYDRPESQGGEWLLVEEIKPIRILTGAEVKTIIAKENVV